MWRISISVKVLVIILLFVTISYPKAEEKAPEDLKLEGNIYFISNNYEKAVSAFIECHNLDSNFFNDYIELGKSYFYLKKYDDALHWYNKAIEKNPTNGLYWSGKASILVQLTKYL